jgi:hypothetical protein
VVTKWASSLVVGPSSTRTVATRAGADIIVVTITGEELTWLTRLRVDVSGHSLTIVTIRALGGGGSGTANLT